MTPPSNRTVGIASLLIGLVAWLGWTGGPANAFDVTSVQRLGILRDQSPALTTGAIALTWLGSAVVTLGGTTGIALVRLLQRRLPDAVWLLATVGGGRMIADGLKLLVDRPRPHFAPYPVPVSSFSFPSGHAANSMVAFVALALTLAPSRWRPFAVTTAVALSIAVGLTRPYLGVHWPSDILAGWMLGGAVLLLATSVRSSAARTAA